MKSPRTINLKAFLSDAEVLFIRGIQAGTRVAFLIVNVVIGHVVDFASSVAFDEVMSGVRVGGSACHGARGFA